MGHCKVIGLLLSVVMVVGLWAAPSALAEEQPRRGGVLRVAIAGDPPSLDMHQEQTFMVDIPMSPVYNTLVMFDPHNYPKVIGDLAKEMQQELIKKAWWLPALWWSRAEVRSSRIRNYEPQPSHWMNRRLEDVWLSEK